MHPPDCHDYSRVRIGDKARDVTVEVQVSDPTSDIALLRAQSLHDEAAARYDAKVEAASEVSLKGALALSLLDQMAEHLERSDHWMFDHRGQVYVVTKGAGPS